jgi:ABC-type lipoprotein release transport system permease subunit
MNGNFAFMPLSSMQRLMSAEEKVTSIALMIAKQNRLSEMTQSLQRLSPQYLEIMNWEQMMPDITNHMKTDAVSFGVFSGILYLIIGFGLWSTVMMMMTERKYELGMLMAVGMRKSLLKWMLLGETLMISFLGAACGLAISFPLTWWFEIHPVRFTGKLAETYEKFGFEAVMPTVTDPQLFITQCLIVLSIALITGMYPYYHIGRLEPASAMRK